MTLLSPERATSPSLSPSVPPAIGALPALREHRRRREDTVRGVEAGDSVLVARLMAGDEEALAEVWERHGALVFGLARRITGDSTSAEDVTQDVFVTLWQRPERFDPRRGSLRAFLGVQTQRRAIDLMRRDGRRAQREQRHHRLHPELRATPDDDVAGGVLSDMVGQAIGKLPAEQRAVVELAYFRGLTQREVAVALGIPEGTAKSRLRLAQSKLQSWLDPNLLEFV